MSKEYEIDVLMRVRNRVLGTVNDGPYGRCSYICILVRHECRQLSITYPNVVPLSDRLRAEVHEFLDHAGEANSCPSLGEYLGLPEGSPTLKQYRIAILDTMLARRGVVIPGGLSGSQ